MKSHCIILLLLLFLFLFAVSPLARAGIVDFKAGPGGIDGHADGAELGEVMQALSEKTGYTIFLDQRLEGERISFSFEAAVKPESAIRQIVGPYSHAISFAGPSPEQSRIEKVWVFMGNDPIRVDYLFLQPNLSREISGEISGETSPKEAALASPGRTFPGETVFKKGAKITRSPFGTPVIHRPNPLDRRPTVQGMRKKLIEHRNDREQKRRRHNHAMRMAAQRQAAREKAAYEDQRNEKIRKMLMKKDRDHE